MVNLDERELATMLAALRWWQVTPVLGRKRHKADLVSSTISTDLPGGSAEIGAR